MERWTKMPAGEVPAGSTVRYRSYEFTVARIDRPFLGREGMVCLIEHTPQRWHAYAAPVTAEVEVLERG